jgi:hypothetical protein
MKIYPMHYPIAYGRWKYQWHVWWGDRHRFSIRVRWPIRFSCLEKKNYDRRR